MVLFRSILSITLCSLWLESNFIDLIRTLLHLHVSLYLLHLGLGCLVAVVCTPDKLLHYFRVLVLFRCVLDDSFFNFTLLDLLALHQFKKAVNLFH
jgi:hypothetical protein